MEKASIPPAVLCQTIAPQKGYRVPGGVKVKFIQMEQVARSPRGRRGQPTALGI